MRFSFCFNHEYWWFTCGKVQVGNFRKRRNQNEIPGRNSHSKNRGDKRYLYLAYRRPSEQLFPKRRPLSYPTLNKNMKTHIRLKQYKILLQNIKQIEPQQKYSLGTISNIKLLGGLNRFYWRLTSPSSYVVASKENHVKKYKT